MDFLDDEIDQALTGAADDAVDDAAAKRARTGKLWLNATAKNSPEIELRAMKFEKLTKIEMRFGDDGLTDCEPADAETIREAADGAMLFDFHISLARSLPENSVWSDYIALCKAEGVQEMPPYHGGRL